MKNIIITGGTGFIGKYMISTLLNEGYEVYAVVRNASRLSDIFEHVHCHIIESDFSDLSVEKFPPINYDIFLHLGWGGVNRKEIDDKDIHMKNYNESVKCLHIANDIKCSLFADSGSRAEYGNECEFCTEDNVGNPSSAYGYYKKKFYEYALRYCSNKCNYVHFRLFSVIGPDDHPWSLISTACTTFLKNDELQVGACNQLWNFMSVDDVCKAILTVIESYHELPEEDNRIINIASADTRVLKEFIKEIHRLANSSSKVIFDTSKTGYPSNPSIEKLSNIFLWKDKTSFEEEILKIFSKLGK